MTVKFLVTGIHLRAPADNATESGFFLETVGSELI